MNLEDFGMLEKGNEDTTAIKGIILMLNILVAMARKMGITPEEFHQMAVSKGDAKQNEFFDKLTNLV